MAVDARRAGMLALVVLASAIVGALLVWDGSPLALGEGPRPVVVRVVNEGGTSAPIQVSASFLETGRTMRNGDTLPAGAASEFPLGTVEGQVSVRLRVEWTFGGSTGSGERGAIVEPDQCARGETAVLVMPFRTAQGVTFGTTQRLCL